MQYLEEVDRNWRATRYELKTSDYNFYWEETRLEVGEDFITAGNRAHTQVNIFDRESVELKREFRLDGSMSNYQVIDVDTVACLDSFELTFNDTKTSELIRQFKLNEVSVFEACCPRAKLWTVTYFEHGKRLALWRVDNASKVVIKTIEVTNPDPFNVRNQFKVYEQFILQHHQTIGHPSRDTCHFISTGIVHNTVLERCL